MTIRATLLTRTIPLSVIALGPWCRRTNPGTHTSLVLDPTEQTSTGLCDDKNFRVLYGHTQLIECYLRCLFDRFSRYLDPFHP